MRAGSAQDILSVQSTKDTQRMMEGLTRHNYESFWEINQPLCDKPLADIRKYAIRIFTNKHSQYIQPLVIAPAGEQ